MSSQNVVLSIGSRFITSGFSGQAYPLAKKRTNLFDLEDIFRSNNEQPSDSQGQILWDYSSTNCDLLQLEFVLEKLIYDTLTEELLIDPKRSKITFIESIFFPIPYKDIITRVCLYNLHCVSITFVPEPLMSCVGSGSQCGLVVDLGWFQSSVTPVFDLRVLYKETESTVRSGCMLHTEVHALFKEHTGIPLDFEFIERFIIEVSYCRTEREGDEKDEEYFTFDGVKIPNSFRYIPLEKVLFGDPPYTDDDNQHIPDIILKILENLPIDLRGDLLSRLIFTGGVSQIPGVKAAILNELSKRSTLKQPLRSILTLGPWKGTSLYLSTASISSQAQNKPVEVHRDKYLAEEERMVDWTDTLYS